MTGRGKTLKEKLDKHSAYSSEIEHCFKCSLNNKKCYAGTGPITATIMIVGQAPSLNRTTAIHFSGKSHKAFSHFLEELDLHRDNVWITNVVKCIEPKRKTGEPTLCASLLRKEIRLIKPNEIFLFGKVATAAVFGKPIMYSSFRKENVLYHILPHPMTAVYNREEGRAKYLEELARVKEYRKARNIKNSRQEILEV